MAGPHCNDAKYVVQLNVLAPIAKYHYIGVAQPWAPAGIFQRGKTGWTDKNDLFFGAPKAQTKIVAIFSAL